MKKIARNILLVLGTALLGLKVAWAGLPLQQWTHASGAQVWLVSSPAIPMLDVQLDFDGGSRRDPPGRAGLAAMMAELLAAGVARGGTPDEPALDENALSEAWMDLGAQFGVAAGADRLSATLRTLTDPARLMPAAELAGRQLASPAFPATVWQRERERALASLRESLTRPGAVAARAYAPAVYGGHPYGALVTEASLGALTVDDLRAVHARTLRPCRARVSLVGAVTREQADALVTALLRRLPSGDCPTLPPVPEVAPLAAAQDLRIPFEAAQAQVLLGQPGIRRDDPDFLALLVGNHILGGGGFTSRLTQAVREARGLTYGIHSSFSPGLHAGAFTIGLQTRPDQAAQALQLTREVLARFVAEGPTEAEVQAAKEHLIGGFALRLDSNRKLLDQVAQLAWNGLPTDYLDTWTERVARVTAADIRAAFGRVVDPARLVTVVVGGRD